MKISKLFHWLYASLMLLPLMVFGVTGLYYGLNQNAQLSERTETTDNYYQWSDSNITQYNPNQLQNNTIYMMELICQDNDLTYQFAYLSIYINYCVETEVENIEISGETPYLLNYDYASEYLYFSDTTTTTYINGFSPYDESGSLKLLFAIDGNTTDFIENFLDNTNSTNKISGVSQEILIPNGTNSTTTNTNDISTSIINAWNSTWQNPLFSWSSDSFLIAPFNYITDLFSIPQNNTFSMALSYWLAISIVYLVFDLVMYVPLLAHRWIDKGMVE